MVRALRVELAGALLCAVATSVMGEAPFGAISATFNDARPFVDETAAGSFLPFVARNSGPQHADQAYAFGAYVRDGSAISAGTFESRLGVRGVEDLRGGLGAQLAAERALLGTTPPASLGGLLTAGTSTFVASNRSRSDGTFESWLFAFGIAATQRQLLGSVKLTPDHESEEVSDFQFSALPSETAQVGASFYAVSGVRSGACREPVVTHAEIKRVNGFPLLDSQGRYIRITPAQMPQCHTGAARLRLEPVFSIRLAETRKAATSAPKVHLEPKPAWLGVRCRETAAGADEVCLYKLLDDGTRMTLDATFGGDGQVIVRAAGASIPARYWDHAIDAEGRVLVSYGLGRADGSFVRVVLRLRADGTLDPAFAINGVHTIPTTGASTNPRSITSDVNGNIQVSGETSTATGVRPFLYFYTKPSPAEPHVGQLVEYAFAGHSNSAFFAHVREPDGTLTAVGTSYGSYPDPATMRPLVVQLVGPAAAQPAVEYFHAGFGHHATIVNPEEIGKLDRGEIAGWSRTGWHFNVYPIGTPGTAAVDRFFTTAFPPKSSHVYSANAAESAAIRQDRAWTFEGTVFGAILPSADGTCSPSARTVSRVYNNGATGAPNHRYADADEVIASALAAGGVLEGSGARGAFYCTE